MINITYITSTINTVIDTLSLFIVSALPMKITHYKISDSKKGPIWRNVTSNTNDDFPPKDGDAPGILKGEYIEEEPQYLTQVIRGEINPSPIDVNNEPLLDNLFNDGLTHQPALLGLLPTSL